MPKFSMKLEEIREMVGYIHDLKGKYVHHIDGDRTNNTLDNFAVVTPKQHRRIHVLMGGIRPMSQIKKRYGIKEANALIALYNEGIWIETFCTD
uniref:Putative homing endonuclease n=1 Tax=viral metagenome TaxID=1070528 RepID=A0A6M3JSE1_9ZZZZ